MDNGYVNTSDNTESTGTSPLQQTKEQTQKIAGEAMDKARGTVKSQLMSQKERAAASLTDVADAIRQAGQQLQDKGQAPVGQYATSAADQVTRLSTYLNEREVDQLVDEVQSFARSKPTLFLGGAVALGLLAARFLKSSGTNGQNSWSGNGSTSRALVPQTDMDHSLTRTDQYQTQPVGGYGGASL